jgi:hypothetical protein
MISTLLLPQECKLLCRVQKHWDPPLRTASQQELHPRMCFLTGRSEVSDPRPFESHDFHNSLPHCWVGVWLLRPADRVARSLSSSSAEFSALLLPCCIWESFLNLKVCWSWGHKLGDGGKVVGQVRTYPAYRLWSSLQSAVAPSTYRREASIVKASQSGQATLLQETPATFPQSERC